jgi:putative SOS response-associated peptidase YedK
MCGRYSAAGKLTELAKFIDFVLKAPAQVARYNIAPRQSAPVIISESGRPTLKSLRWGLIPAWAEDEKIGDQLINARSETIFTKPAFRLALRERRCLIPADGFYEWQRQGAERQPYRFTLRNGAYFCFAGIWESWRRPPMTGELDFGQPLDARPAELETFSILTTTANGVVAPVHDRMPVILPPAHYAAWLDHRAFDPEPLQSLLGPLPADEMQATRVSSRVNNARHDAPDCLLPA